MLRHTPQPSDGLCRGGPRRSRAGRRIKALTSCTPPSGAMPSRGKGRSSTQTMGCRTRAMSASGQQSTRRISQRTNAATLSALRAALLLALADGDGADLRQVVEDRLAGDPRADALSGRRYLPLLDELLQALGRDAHGAPRLVERELDFSSSHCADYSGLSSVGTRGSLPAGGGRAGAGSPGGWGGGGGG